MQIRLSDKMVAPEIAPQITHSGDVHADECLENAEVQYRIKKNGHVEQCALERANALRELSKFVLILSVWYRANLAQCSEFLCSEFLSSLRCFHFFFSRRNTNQRQPIVAATPNAIVVAATNMS